MARPLSVSDDDILDATNAALAELGSEGLTMSEVARRVGLTRAAISQRFGTLQDLKRRLTERLATNYEARLGAMTLEPGGRGLIAVADMLGKMMGQRENFSGFMLRYNANINDPILIGLEERRGQALRALIARAMPETALPRDAAVDAFMAHMTGSMLNWQTSQHPDAAVFLTERTANWLRLAHIALDEAGE